MSRPEVTSTNLRNDANANILSRRNLSQIPRSSYSNIERFTLAPAADCPYFAGARMQERPAHIVGLSSQLNAVDEIMKTGR